MPTHRCGPLATGATRRALLAAALSAPAALATTRRAAAQAKPAITIWLDTFNGGETSRRIVEHILEPYGEIGTATVEATLMPNSWDTARVALAGGEGPDLVTTPGPGLAMELARAGQLLALDGYVASERWAETFAPWALELGVVEETLYSLPFEAETLVLYYNKTLFTEHGWTVPATMAELMTLCALIDEAGIVPFAHCNAEWRAANGWFVGEFLNHIAGPQAVYQALTGAASFTDPPFVEAIATLTAMQQNGWFMGGLDRYYTTTFADANAAFAAGEAAMKIEGTWWLPNADIFWGPAAGNDMEWDWAPVPSGDGQPIFTLGLASFAINARTDHPDEAAQFLTYFFSPDTQATLVTDCLLAPGPVALPEERLSALDPRHAAILTELNTVSAMNAYGYTVGTFFPPKTETYLTQEIEKVWAGDLTVEDYLAGIQSLFDAEQADGGLLPIPAR